MSLWYESLSFALYDCGDNSIERARCILAYLSMPVPRSWWEQAMQTGRVEDGSVSLLCEMQMELSKSVDFNEPLSLDLLVALAFIDDDDPLKPSDRFDDTESKYSPNDYLDRAKSILAKRPELTQVSSLIKTAKGLCADKGGT